MNWFQCTKLLVLISLSVSPVACDGETVEKTAQAANDRSGEEVVILNGQTELIDFLQSEEWWGEGLHGETLRAPRLVVTGINPTWPVNAEKLPVAQKKELFYRLMLPLVLHANAMVEERRAHLLRALDELETGGRLTDESLAWVKKLALILPGMTPEEAADLEAHDPELAKMIESMLYRVDVIPPGLALGQAAYESGYGTSRFAVEGNSLFGQWTYGGDGLVPRQQRKSTKGDHKIAAYEWPFDSVRGYFINLMSHRAYEDFRQLRAKLRKERKPLDSLVLADGLGSYSERGMEYVESLKGMIRANKLYLADSAVLRDEPLRFLVIEPTDEGVREQKARLGQMRESGELAEIRERMRLD